MLISVIVPHLNQESYLEAGLAALNDQIGYSGELEILVVDNGSERLPEKACSQWPNVRLLSEATPGPGPARNHGADIARGELIAFIDADCLAHRSWLATIERAFDDEEQQIIGGDVRVSYQRDGCPQFHEPYEAIYSYRNEMHIAEGFSGTGNLAVRPSVLKSVGPFAGIGVSEDRDWGLRAIGIGYRITYVPDMIVTHPTRPTYRDLTKKWDRHIAHDYARVQGPRAALLWALKAVAMAVSPLAEIPEILTSRRIAERRERLLAFACLARIRMHRAIRMVQILRMSDNRAHSNSWNRS